MGSPYFPLRAHGVYSRRNGDGGKRRARRAEDREARRRDTWAAPASPCPIVDQELDVFPAFPVVGAQLAGEMESAAACVEQGIAERLAQAAERDGLEARAAGVRQETADMVVADDIGLGDPRAGERKARLRIARAERSDSLDLFL